MARLKIGSFLKELGMLITYCFVINVILGLFYAIANLINGFYLLETGYHFEYLIGYLIVVFIVVIVSRVIEPYKFTKKADIEFIRNYTKISANPNYFAEIGIYLLSSLCTFMLGLALGPQGPSIYVGMLTALLFYKFIFKTSKTTEEEQIILGSSVGYTVAFLNPVAGLCFAMEKSKCKMSIKLVLKLVLALAITYLFQTIFRQRILSEYFITLTGHMNYWLLLAIPVIVFVISIVGILINTFFSIIRKHINYENKIVKLFMSILILIIPIVIKVYQPQILGSGLLSLKWIFSDLSIATIAIYGVIRIVFTYFSVETKFSGGVGGSIIIIGAILGRLIAGLFGYFIEMSSNDIYIITIATMLSFYGMFTKEKYTSISLIFSFGNFVYLIAPCAVGYLTMIGVHHAHIAIKKRIKNKKLLKHTSNTFFS